ncbi:MAG: hypothetical protein PHP22_03520 [Oscillospiraceae bacterium]|nr:hypothetical protein [Oscillospiraceae bacterium]
MPKCKYCGEPIVWISIEGRKTAVDKEVINFQRNKFGSVRAMCNDWLVHRGYLVGDANENGYEFARTLHWSTCKRREWK